MCTLSLSLEPFVGYTLRGEHGELVKFGVSEVLEHVDGCPEFVEVTLRTFGPGGARSLEEPVYFPYEGLGRKPRSRAEPEE